MVERARFSISEVEAFLRRALSDGPPGPDIQRRFAPRPLRDDWQPDRRPAEARHAAALILIHPGPDGLSLPLTVRRSDLPHHPGQISLPGGALDPGERPDAAALREAHEEIGVPPDDVRLVGALSTVWIGVSGFVVHPFVAVTDDTPGFRAHAAEVDRLFDVRLDELCDPGRLRWGRRHREGVPVSFPYFDFHGHVVWGATAMMLGELASLFIPSLAPSAPPDDQDLRSSD